MSGAATPMRLLPILLPSRWTTPGTCGQLWNGGSAYGQRRTILGAVPTPTDQRVAVHHSAAPSRKDQPRRLVQFEPIRTAVPRAANAVGWQHPPGFKSPILRSCQSPGPGPCVSGPLCPGPCVSGPCVTDPASSTPLSTSRRLGLWITLACAEGSSGAGDFLSTGCGFSFMGLTR
jgi:hypothetical protein